jgi:hypothetical protein
MKLATRISSIRRSAWKQCRSCPLASETTCADSLASHWLAGWTVLAFGVQHGGHRVLGQPVDLESGAEPLQFLGHGHVAAGVAEPDRGGQVQGPLGRHGPRVQVVACMDAPVILSTNR